MPSSPWYLGKQATVSLRLFSPRIILLFTANTWIDFSFMLLRLMQAQMQFLNGLSNSLHPSRSSLYQYYVSRLLDLQRASLFSSPLLKWGTFRLHRFRNWRGSFEDRRTCELITSIPQRVLIRSQLSVAVMGIIQLTRGKTSTSLKEGLFEGTSPNPSAYALALFSGLWAYEGWDQGMEFNDILRIIDKLIQNLIIYSKLHNRGDEGSR